MSSIRSKYQPKQPVENPTISTGEFVGGAVAVVSLGVIIGVKYTLKKEKETFAANVNGSMLAAKALGIGTVLCFGTFAALTGIFIVSTGITSFAQFNTEARKVMKVADVNFSGRDLNSAEAIAEDLEAKRTVDTFVDDIIKSPISIGTLLKMNKPDGSEGSEEKAPREPPILQLFKDKNGELIPAMKWVKKTFEKKKKTPTDTTAAEGVASPPLVAVAEQHQGSSTAGPRIVVDSKSIVEPSSSSSRKPTSTVSTELHGHMSAPTVTVETAISSAAAAGVAPSLPERTTYSYLVTMLFGQATMKPPTADSQQAEGNIKADSSDSKTESKTFIAANHNEKTHD